MFLHVHPSSDDASAAAADCLADGSDCAIGLDVGGTKIAGGLLSVSDGQILARRLQPTGAERGGRAVLNDVFQLASELAAEGSDRNRVVRAVGLGVCELVDREGRQLSANRIAWMRRPILGTLHCCHASKHLVRRPSRPADPEGGNRDGCWLDWRRAACVASLVTH